MSVKDTGSIGFHEHVWGTNTDRSKGAGYNKQPLPRVHLYLSLGLADLSVASERPQTASVPQTKPKRRRFARGSTGVPGSIDRDGAFR